MKKLYDEVSSEISKCITRRYSTSFSLGIFMLDKSIHRDIYAIYGFVRIADEIVDSFHDFNKSVLLDKFENETREAIENGISLNPVLNAFQRTVRKHEIEWDLIQTFLESMRMDLSCQDYDEESFRKYILGSAEVVGLMCLRVFVEGDKKQYEALQTPAMKLGAAFQKVNFLRDLEVDFHRLGRSYFPDCDPANFSEQDKLTIEASIENDFREAEKGIKELPKKARRGVYTAYLYYMKLFRKIQRTTAKEIMSNRIRISNQRKLLLLLSTLIGFRPNLVH